MKKGDSLLYKFFDANLLFYSWAFLKNQKSFSFSKNNLLTPISYRWFYNTAYLIRNGLFKYRSYAFLINSDKMSNYVFIKVLKYRILELSFVFLLAPFFLGLFFKDNLCNCHVRFLKLIHFRY